MEYNESRIQIIFERSGIVLFSILIQHRSAYRSTETKSHGFKNSIYQTRWNHMKT